MNTQNLDIAVRVAKVAEALEDLPAGYWLLMKKEIDKLYKERQAFTTVGKSEVENVLMNKMMGLL